MTHSVGNGKGCSLLSKRALVRGGDWAMALSAALAENDEVYIPAGEYRMSAVNVPSGKTVYGDGASSRLIPIGRRLFNITGTESAVSGLASDAEDNGSVFALENDIGLTAGDLVYVFGQRNCQILRDCGSEWTLGRTYSKGFTCFFAEFLRVEAVSDEGKSFISASKSIFPGYRADGTREHPPKKPHTPRDDYPFMRSCTTVSKILPAGGVILRDLAIAECRGGTAVLLRFADSCRLERIVFSSATDSAPEAGLIFVYASESVDCVISDCTFSVPCLPARRSDYKWADYWSYNTARIVSSQRCGFERCESDFSTHAFEIGKADKHGASSRCFVRGCRASGAVWSGVFIGGGCFDSTVTDCRITYSAQGIVVCGRKNLISGNSVELNADPDADYYYVKKNDGGSAGIALIEGYSVDSTVCRNSVSGADTAFLIRDGYEDDNRFESGNILICQNTSQGCGRAVMVYRNTSNIGKNGFTLTLRENSFYGSKGCAVLADKEAELLLGDDNLIEGYGEKIQRLPASRRCFRKAGGTPQPLRRDPQAPTE